MCLAGRPLMPVAKINPRLTLDVSSDLAAKYFRALGDPTRLKIVELLMEGPLTVTQLTQQLRIPQSNVSNHVACLRWCGFVASENQGKWTYYSITNSKIRKVVELIRTLVRENAEHLAACTRIDEK